MIRCSPVLRPGNKITSVTKWINGVRSIYQFSNMAPRLQANKLLHLLLFSLNPSVLRKLKGKRNFKKFQFCPESLAVMLECWYVSQVFYWEDISNNQDSLFPAFSGQSSSEVLCTASHTPCFWKYGQTHSFLLYILHKEQFNFKITLSSAWCNHKVCSWVLLTTVCS